MITSGDQLLQTSLATKGGKGLFTKELELALLSGEAHMAVHSMKDVPANLAKDFIIAAIPERDSPFDAFVANEYSSLHTMPKGSVIGTSSARRICQLQYHYPDLIFKLLRGNVQTRLSKLDAKEFDGIILAEAGLCRLGLQHRITTRLTLQECLPAVGQGALAIECRREDEILQALLKPLQHEETALCVTAERAMNQALGGGCEMPVAGYAHLTHGILHLKGMVGGVKGQPLIFSEASSDTLDPMALGEQVATLLKQQGAQDMLQQFTSRDSPS